MASSDSCSVVTDQMVKASSVEETTVMEESLVAEMTPEGKASVLEETTAMVD